MSPQAVPAIKVFTIYRLKNFDRAAGSIPGTLLLVAQGLFLLTLFFLSQ
jgi:hypothetical protein